ncbi:site-specific integrase [Shewanella baltica]|uniref:site-specific integrase n=1 Tax=Shewanella baltica TaxID=62322 RepID=UPI00217EEFF0|nr:site-specific integrase [Shewanella baltica]
MVELALLSYPQSVTDDRMEDFVYKPFFTDKQIKARTRMVDTSSQQWDIGESKAVSINFELIETANLELIDQVKYLIAQFVRSKSPGHALAIFCSVKNFLNLCESFDEHSDEALGDALADEMLYHFAGNRKMHGENELNRVRLWYRLGVKLKLPMFQKVVIDALRKLKLAGSVKGLDVLIYIEGKSPLNSNQLGDLRQLLQHYSTHFEVGESNYWRLAATWVFITLGVRPCQLQQLMITDLAVHTSTTSQNLEINTYLLNVPSSKKRNEPPRTRFKSRPIPAFLGKILVNLKEFNIEWLNNNGHSVEANFVPLFMPTSHFELRKPRSRHSAFEYCFSTQVIYLAPDFLLKHLNILQVEKRDATVDLKINPRRLRKTFATHAAACGTPAMVLAELLDHEDMQHVMIYYKLGANFAIKINRIYHDQFGSILDFFKGKITFKELNDNNKNQQVFGPEGLRRLVGIGFCSKETRCRLVPPYSCYTCVKFEACNNKGLHEEVLNVMVKDVEQLFENNVAPGKFDMVHIKACKSLIQQLEIHS